MDDLLDVMKIRVETLEERIRQLEEALAPSSVFIPIEWGLSTNEARMFAHFTTRELATKSSLMMAVYSDRPDDVEPEIKIIDVFVCKMRKKLARFDIEIRTVWGQGYSLQNREQFTERRVA
jgi:two-component system cell cycle response regulator CtrA